MSEIMGRPTGRLRSMDSVSPGLAKESFQMIPCLLIGAVDFRNQRSNLVPSHEHDRRAAEQMTKCQELTQDFDQFAADYSWASRGRLRNLNEEFLVP